MKVVRIDVCVHQEPRVLCHECSAPAESPAPPRAECWALVDRDGIVQSEVFATRADARAEADDWPDCRLVKFVEERGRR